MRNRDRRYERYQHDDKFHKAVKMIEALIHNYNFTHEDIQDAAFVACMKHIQENPIPLLLIPEPKETK